MSSAGVHHVVSEPSTTGSSTVGSAGVSGLNILTHGVCT